MIIISNIIIPKKINKLLLLDMILYIIQFLISFMAMNISNKENFNDTPWSPEGKSLFEEINPKERHPEKETKL